MSIFIPSKPINFNSSPAEEEIFDCLSLLSDEYYIFHSLRWVNENNEKSFKSQGEADFVLLHKKLGILIIEVKGGELRYEGRQWFQKNRKTGIEKEIQDPEQQASNSKFIILEKVKERIPSNETCMVCHCVWFPNVVFPKKDLPLNYVPEIIFDLNTLTHPDSEVKSAFNFWERKRLPKTDLSEFGFQKIIQVLAPFFKVTTSLRSELEKLTRQFIKLTDQQCRIIEFLDEQKTAAISGVAGTGKTVVALERAKNLISHGEDVIFLCYNSALKKYLQNNLSLQGIRFHSFHSLAALHVKNKDHHTTVTEFLNILSDDDSKISFENLIVDEGQDFQSEWLDWLQYRTKGSFYVFYDPNQLLFLSEIPNWFRKVECRLVLKRICRSTRQISNTALKFVESKLQVISSTAEGSKPNLHSYASEDELIKSIAKLIRALTTKGKYEPHEIAILTMETFDNSALQLLKKEKNIIFDEEIKKGSVCLTSVRKFKGLEAKVIIVSDINLEKSNLPEWRNRLYVGCSRAMHELHLFIKEGDEKSFSISINQITGKKKLVIDELSFARIIESKWSEE